MNHVLILIAAALTAVTHSTNKLYARNTPRRIRYILFFPAFTALLIALITLACTGFRPKFSAFGAGIAAAHSLSCCIYMMIGIAVSNRIGSALYTMFVQLGGMLVPFAFGILFLDEVPTVCCVIGAVLVAAALILSAVFAVRADKKAGDASTSSGKRGKRAAFGLLAVIFLLSGAGSSLMKFHQVSARAIGKFEYICAGNSASAVVGFAAIGIITLVLHLKKRRRGSADRAFAVAAAQEPAAENAENAEQIAAGNAIENAAENAENAERTAAEKARAKKRTALAMVLICATYSIFSTASGALTMTAAAHLPATAMFPFLTGGGVIFGTLFAAVLFRERITRFTVLTLALMLAGTILFMF